ncbi:MAG: hypothetical protein GY742_16510 [Hyphomicrobiales bacterium]|nr:hypothetical protein [Hyphomicrobiales bacterium]
MTCGRIYVAIIGFICFLVASGQAFSAGTSNVSKPVESEKKSEHGANNKEHDDAEEMLPKEPDFRFSSSYQELPQGENEPWKLIRRLQKAQDKIVAGLPHALEDYRNMLIDYSAIMLKFQGQTWAHERNLDAAAAYVLIGGNPQVGKIALKRSILGKSEKSPLKAAIAFSERNIDEAYRMLNANKPSVLPPSLAGQFALARAMITSSINLDLTENYLNDARRLAPGTLIEEAALRRLLRVAGISRNFDKFKFFSSTYMRRFHKSYYLNDFLKSYAYAIVQMPQENQSESLKELQDLLEYLDKRQDLFVLAFIARSATILGRTKLALWAANEALGELRVGSKLHTRMKLYAVASGIVDDKITEEAAEMLKQIDSDVFDINDKKLFDAVTVLSQRLLSPSLDSDQLKAQLKDDHQAYPGEEPKMPAELIKQVDFLKTNSFVMRYENLSKNYEAILSEINQ